MTTEDRPGRRTGLSRAIPKRQTPSTERGVDFRDRLQNLTPKSIDTALSVFDAILTRADVNPALVGELKAALLDEREAAVKREGQEGEIRKLRGEADALRRISRRHVLRNAAMGVITVAGAKYVWETFFSPEVQERQRQKEVQRKERERQEKLAFERDNTLGLKPSTVSYAGWRIRYPQRDETVDFTEASNVRIAVLNNGGSIAFAPKSVFGSTRATRIAVEHYTRLDGVSVPLLVVYTAAYSEERWVLRDHPTPEINNGVVIFEHLGDKEIIYLSINPIRSQPPAFEVKRMETQKIVPK